jgi:cell division protein FtsW
MAGEQKQKQKKKKHYYDYSLVFAIVFLTAFGLLMIYSSSSYTAEISAKTHDAAYYMKRQGFFALIGFALMAIISHIDYHKIIRFALPLYILSYMLMIAVSMFGRVVNGKRRWLGIGSFSFQPTEFAKIALIIFLTVYIANMGKEIDTMKGIFRVFLLDIPIAGLVAANNLSSGVIIFGLALVMTFVASRQRLFYAAFAALCAAGAFFAQPVAKLLRNVGVLKGYQLSRILVWENPAAYPQDGGYQVLQGLYAIGSGGVIGKGLGESIQKMGFVPEAQNDMIFAIICEELGLFGAVSIILVFMFMIYRFIMIANSAPDLYGSMLVVGVMAHIAIQVILNIAVVTNLIPNTGITLPFISYGGTSVFFLMMEMGLVLSVSRRIRLDY